MTHTHTHMLSFTHAHTCTRTQSLTQTHPPLISLLLTCVAVIYNHKCGKQTEQKQKWTRTAEREVVVIGGQLDENQ